MMAQMVKQAVCQQTQNIFLTFIQRRPNVFDVGPTLYKCYKMFCVCLLGGGGAVHRALVTILTLFVISLRLFTHVLENVG